MISLPAINPWLLLAVLAVGFGSGWTVNGWRLDGVTRDAVTAAENAAKAECEEAQKTTQEVSDEYQKKLRGINAAHAAAVKRMRDACTVPVTDAPGGRDATPAGNQLPGPHPVAVMDLLDLARLADVQTAQLLACQDFLRRQ